MDGCSVFCQPKSIQLNVYACYIVIIKQAPSIFIVLSAPLPVFRPLQTTSRIYARVYFERSHRAAFRPAVFGRFASHRRQPNPLQWLYYIYFVVVVGAVEGVEKSRKARQRPKNAYGQPA